MKNNLLEYGYCLYGNEPLKITIAAKSHGYSGTVLAELLSHQHILPEFADPDYLVLMLTPETGREGLSRLQEALMQIPKRDALTDHAPAFQPAVQAMPVREALLSCSEMIPVSGSFGRILAVPTVGCPPAVPIVACGERIDSHAIACFDYYGIQECCVVKENRGEDI